MEVRVINTVDLFCGCGGMSLGFQNAGFNILAAYDNWDAAINIYRENFSHPIVKEDLNTDKAIEAIRALVPDIIIGGPPCQDFSIAGQRNMGERANLTIRYAQIIAEIKPEWFVMENVYNIERMPVLPKMMQIVKDAGYGLSVRILDASRCGVPQKRNRFFKAKQNDSEITIGYSSGSKFWSSSYLSIPEYVSWCDSFGLKIVNSTLVVKTNTNYDHLPFPTKIKQYQNNILFAFFSEKAYLSPPTLRVAGVETKAGLITDADIKIVGITKEKDGIVFDFVLNDITEQLICNTDGVYSSISPQFVCRDGSKAIPLFEYLNENPLIFKAADDTVYSGHEVLLGNVVYERFDQGRITVLDWNSFNTNVSVEARSKHNAKNSKKSTSKNTIQETLQKTLDQDKDYAIIICDHGPGEVADYIAFKNEESTIQVELYHCKAMKGKNYNSDVSDVYEVSQQAIKSTIWIKSKSALLEKLTARIKGAKKNKFIRGDIATLKNLLKSQKILEARIFIVQPAISKSKPMKDAVGTVLSAATFYVTNTGRTKSLEFIGSK